MAVVLPHCYPFPVTPLSGPGGILQEVFLGLCAASNAMGDTQGGLQGAVQESFVGGVGMAEGRFCLTSFPSQRLGRVWLFDVDLSEQGGNGGTWMAL